MGFFFGHTLALINQHSNKGFQNSNISHTNLPALLYLRSWGSTTDLWPVPHVKEAAHETIRRQTCSMRSKRQVDTRRWSMAMVIDSSCLVCRCVNMMTTAELVDN